MLHRILLISSLLVTSCTSPDQRLTAIGVPSNVRFGPDPVTTPAKFLSDFQRICIEDPLDRDFSRRINRVLELEAEDVVGDGSLVRASSFRTEGLTALEVELSFDSQIASSDPSSVYSSPRVVCSLSARLTDYSESLHRSLKSQLVEQLSDVGRFNAVENWKLRLETNDANMLILIVPGIVSEIVSSSALEECGGEIRCWVQNPTTLRAITPVRN